MAHERITASLEDFARTGQLGPIALGVNRSDVRDKVGPPSDWVNGVPVDQSAIWKYGDVELYFDDEDRLYMIHFDWFESPVGGGALQLLPWVIRQGLPLEELKRALLKAGVTFEAGPDKSNPDCVKIVTRSGVTFLVQIEGDVDDLGLRVFGHSAATC